MSSTETTEQAKKVIKVRKLPFNIKKSDMEGFKFMIPIKKSMLHTEYKEDVLYKASENDFLKGKYPNLVIINKLNIINCSSRTVATYTCGRNIELNSDAVTKLIGQKNYDTLFTALCSIISPQLRIEGILALLTENKHISVETQTLQTHSDQFIKEKTRRNKTKRRTVNFYPVKDEMLEAYQMKKVIIDPENVKLIEPESIKLEAQVKSLPELNLDEDSNMSSISLGNMSIGSNFSIGSLIDLFTDPKSSLEAVNKHTDIENIYTNITMLDGTSVTIKGNPDIFHLTSPEILEELSSSDKTKLLCYQAYIDWKFCLQQDNDGILPFHQAVMNNDVDVLKRHCAMLKTRRESVDIPAAHENMTALQLAIQQDRSKCTEILLHYGADPLIVDEEDRNTLHLAADVSSENVVAVLGHCRKNAREILRDSHSWTFEMEKKSDEELVSMLLNELCKTFDNSGYTPLMIASKKAKYENVSLLVEAAPTSVNMKTPTSGDTALYLAVAAACIQTRDSSDHTKVSTDFLKTVEILMKNGAIPAIENLSGNNINTLLTEFYIKDLSVLIANEFTSLNYFGGKLKKDFSDYIIVKSENGEENIEEIKPKSNVSVVKSDKVTVKSVKILPPISEGSSKIVLPSTHRSVIVDHRRPIILRKPIKLNVNKTKLIPILKNQNIKRSSEDISKDITNKKVKS